MQECFAKRTRSVRQNSLCLDSDNLIAQEPQIEDLNEEVNEVKRTHTMQLIRQMENSIYYTCGSTMERWSGGNIYTFKEYSVNLLRMMNEKNELVVLNIDEIEQKEIELLQVNELNLNGKKIDIILIIGDEASYNLAMKGYLTHKQYLIHWESDPPHRYAFFSLRKMCESETHLHPFAPLFNFQPKL